MNSTSDRFTQHIKRPTLFNVRGRTPTGKFSRLRAGQVIDPEPGCGRALATGERSGVLVVDLDEKNGKSGITAFEARFGPLPDTFTIETPSGGLHLYFNHVEGVTISTGQIGEGIDIRGDGGFVVCPPTPGYEILLDVPLMDVPEALYNALNRKGVPTAVDAGPGVDPGLSVDELLERLRVTAARKGGVWRSWRSVAVPERFVRAQGGTDGLAPEGGSVDTHIWRMFCALAEEPDWAQMSGTVIMRMMDVSLSILQRDDRALGNPLWTPSQLLRKWTAARQRAAANLIQQKEAAELAKALVDSVGVDWRNKLVVTGKGQTPKPCTQNAIIAINGEELRGVRLNERSHIIHTGGALPWDKNGLDRPWEDSDTTQLAGWLGHTARLHMGTKTLFESVVAVAQRRRYDPVADYLDDLQWDGVLRVDSWLIDYAGAPDTDYVRRIGAAWLISAVARTRSPGCQVDTMLILEGPQGRRKSTLLRVLAGGDEFFRDHLPPLGTKDARGAMVGPWIIEMSELEAFNRRETSAIKAWLSTRVDSYRPPYGRVDVHIPRRAVFAGSTNEETYLRDHTGGRRFWGVKAPRCRPEALEVVRDQLWAEAAHRYGQRERWWLDARGEADARAEQELRREVDDWEDVLAYELEHGRKMGDEGWTCGPRDSGVRLGREDVEEVGPGTWRVVRIPAAMVLLVLGVPPGRQDKAMQMRVAKAMKAMGWRKERVWMQGLGQTRIWLKTT